MMITKGTALKELRHVAVHTHVMKCYWTVIKLAQSLTTFAGATQTSTFVNFMEMKQNTQ